MQAAGEHSGPTLESRATTPAGREQSELTLQDLAAMESVVGESDIFTPRTDNFNIIALGARAGGQAGTD